MRLFLFELALLNASQLTNFPSTMQAEELYISTKDKLINLFLIPLPHVTGHSLQGVQFVHGEFSYPHR